MADEIVDLLDEHGNLLGEESLKSEAHKSGLWHTAAHVWVYTSDGKILFQKRALTKELYPDRWDISAAGHVKAGEHPRHAALRELEEELGLKIGSNDLDFVTVTRYSMSVPNAPIINNEFAYVYFYCFDGNIEDINLSRDEVADVKFVTIEDFEESLSDSTYTLHYVPYGDYFYLVISALKELLEE